MRRFPDSWWARYVVALAAVAAALALRGVLDPLVGGGAATTTIYGAIAVAVWFGGALPGLAAAVAGYVASNYLFIEPRGSISIIDAKELGLLVGFAISSAIIIGLGGMMHAARRRAEQSEERLRAFMEHTPDYVLMKDDLGRYVYLNPAGEKLMHVEGGRWRGKTDLELLPEDVARLVRRRDDEVLRAGAPRSYDLWLPADLGARELRSTKFPLRDATGRRFLGSISTDVTEKNRSARALEEARQQLVADVEARKRSEEKLRDAQEQLRVIVDTVPAAIAWTDLDLRIRWANANYASWFGLSRERIQGMSLGQLLGAGGMAEIKPHIERVLRGEAASYERLADLPGLGRRWISAVSTPTYDADARLDGWVSIVTDIHDRKVAEEALREADRRKDEFLAMLAHELRNPLAPIRNAVAILARRGTGDAEIGWSREVIGRQVEQMTRLIDDLLDIERISRGKLLVRKERVALERVIDLALETAGPQINAAGHRLSVVLPSEHVALEGDPTRLAQVFSNLLINSAKYTAPRGSIGVHATLEGEAVAVSIEDNGIGFGPEIATELFRPFGQRPAPSPYAVRGLGIGLSLVQGIVLLHGGSVDAHSSGPGQGSRFTVRLPVAAAAPPPRAARAERPAPSAAAIPAGLRVLVADDNRDAADSLQRVLSLYGYEVKVAYDGAAAIELADAFRPSVAVVDLEMPGTSGYDVARIFRSRNRNGLMLVALTGWGQEADRRRSREAGFDYHLTKPVDPGALNELLSGVAKA
jgi:two-component system CheB/CheR fusion protein